MDTHQANVELQEAALATLLNVCLAPACRGDVFKGGIPVLYNVMDLHIAQQRIQVCCREQEGSRTSPHTVPLMEAVALCGWVCQSQQQATLHLSLPLPECDLWRVLA